jgi:hypothetical protein
MKKTIFALFALLAVIACSQKEVDFQNPDREKDNTPMSFNLSVNAMGGDAETKAALKADWSSGDVVYIFFDAIPTKYVKKTFDGTEWSEEYPGGALVAGDFSADGPAASRFMTAVWFPQGEVTVTYAESKFSFTIGEEKIYSHYMSTHAEYDISGTMVTGTLDMEKPAGFVQFFVPGIDAADAPAYRLMESHLAPKACDYVALAGGVTEAALSAGYSLKGMAFTSDASVTGALFGGYLSTAGEATEFVFSLVEGISADKPAALGTYTLVGIKNIAAGTSMTFPPYGNAAWGTMSPFVDLGFGDILWATGNLKDDGTIVSPWLTGDYYRWGATAVCGASESDCYYVEEELPASRDIADIRSSHEWHMPSKTQFEALTSNTKKTWVTIESTAGRLITSKENGISLFFAAAGEYNSGSIDNLGVYGRYWSTTPATSGLVNYLILSDWHFGINDDYRTWGMQVRPVKAVPVVATNNLLPGIFSVSSTTRVKFSKGNLQATYDGSSWSWAFAANQWSFNNSPGNAYYEKLPNNVAYGPYDLFCWVGKSSVREDTTQMPGKYGLFNSYDDVDFGNTTKDVLKYSWGETIGGGWETLTADELSYLLNERASSTVGGVTNGHFAKAYLFGTVHGLILFPDSYTHPAGVAAPTGVNVTGSTSSWNANKYNATDWARMEAAGAVFLPAAGFKYQGGGVDGIGVDGNYWTSTPSSTSSSYAIVLEFDENNLYTGGLVRKRGSSVRLVYKVN